MKWIVILAIIASVCGAAHGQATTQPSAAENAWTQTVTGFASNLSNNDASIVEPTLANNASIRNFDSESSKTLRDLLTFASDCSVLGIHTYLKMPSELAADMANDFKDVSDLDENVRKQMVPEEAALTRANATASQWLMKTLSPSKDQPVAVIVLRLTTVQTSKDTDTERPGALFILIKGEASGKTYRIKQIVFGNPLDPVH